MDVDHAAWRVMQKAVENIRNSRTYWECELETARKDIATAEQSLASLGKQEFELMEAMNDLRLKVEKGKT